MVHFRIIHVWIANKILGIIIISGRLVKSNYRQAVNFLSFLWSVIMRFSFLLLLFVLFIFTSGCSNASNQPMIPVSESCQTTFGNFDLMNPEFSGYGLMFMGTMDIDPFTETITVTERAGSANYDITGFIASGCTGGCFRYQILSYVDEVMSIELKIENPTSLQVYDVRMIFTNLYGKEVLNSDSYTSLFDPSGGFPFNPQIAFMKENDDRAFDVGPGAIDTELLELAFPTGANPLVDYLIVASFPNQCLEPFEIHDIQTSSYMTPSGGNAEISVKFKDHQDDVVIAAADTTPFTGGLTFLEYQPATETYTAEITNSQGASVGTYNVIFGGMSPGSTVILYDFLVLDVGDDSLEFESPRLIDEYTFDTTIDCCSMGGEGINGYDDNIYLIYSYDDQLDNQQIGLMRSVDGGDTFEYPATMVNSPDPASIHLSPAFDVSPDGTIHAVWCRGDLSGFGSYMEYARSKDNGITFENDIYMSGSYLELFCDIEVVDNDIIHAIRNGAPMFAFSLFSQTTLNGGSSWSPALDLSYNIFPTTGSSEMFPVMDCDSNGNIFVAFMSDYSGNDGVYVTRSTDVGVSYSLAYQLNESDNDSRLACVACDGNDYIHVVWIDLSDGAYDDVRYNVSKDGGVTFSTSVVIDDVDTNANAPSLRVDPNTNKLYLLYSAGNMIIQTSDDGSSWSESIDIGVPGMINNLYIDDDSRLHISWNDDGGRLGYMRSI